VLMWIIAGTSLFWRLKKDLRLSFSIVTVLNFPLCFSLIFLDLDVFDSVG
jgi:hypothetical protein